MQWHIPLICLFIPSMAILIGYANMHPGSRADEFVTAAGYILITGIFVGMVGFVVFFTPGYILYWWAANNFF